MRTETQTTPKAAQASKSARDSKTTINLDADLVAKLRASLRAIGRKQTLEEFIEDMLADMLEPHTGVFEGLIESSDEHRRPEIESKLARIRCNDKRLVRPEPLPRNAIVYGRNLARLDSAISGRNTTRNSLINVILENGLARIESGLVRIIED